VIDYSLNDGIATVSFNVVERPMNVLSGSVTVDFGIAIEKALSDPRVRGVIVTSARKEFVVGADLDELQTITDEAAARALPHAMNVILRRLETSGKPVVAALNGLTLGGGLELALACHYRIAAEHSGMKLGLPEVSIGLIPGGGGTQRLPRLIGLEAALPIMLSGRQVAAREALDLGIIDEIAPPSELLSRAADWIGQATAEDTVQPWDKGGVAVISDASRMILEKALKGLKASRVLPAPAALIRVLQEGLSSEFDKGLAIEAEAFGALAVSPASRNLIRMNFFAMRDARALVGRPVGPEKRVFRKVGVLGGGMMGAGIALVSAQAGLDVVLIDVTEEAAAAGRARALAPLHKKLAAGQIKQEGLDKIAARLLATTDFKALENADIVIEAVFEDREVKADVTRKAEAVLGPNAIYASNTTTLPISSLAEASIRPGQFLGLHFFSPVHRMPLVEVIRGAATTEKTVAEAMDFVAQIAMIPIVVADGRGFFTSRVFGTYIHEGIALVADGVEPALVEQAGVAAGMPVGPLALVDELSQGLLFSIMKQTKVDLGKAYVPQPSDDALTLMVETAGRLGRKSGAGFYDYGATGTKTLWPGLADLFPVSPQQPSMDEVIERLMFVQSLEAARCLEAGIVSERDANLGSVLGWSFPAALGGVIGQIDTIGVEAFLARSQALAERYGRRFIAPDVLRSRARAASALDGRKSVASSAL
jgi:3-hydroxyacyl-CoA dehydrogenase/enoyl-CoA hydratase/3-hydroxybutyryl-CoA epimerase